MMNWRMLFRHDARRARSLAPLKAGSSNALRMAMMAITTSNSMRVKAPQAWLARPANSAAAEPKRGRLARAWHRSAARVLTSSGVFMNPISMPFLDSKETLRCASAAWIFQEQAPVRKDDGTVQFDPAAQADGQICRGKNINVRQTPRVEWQAGWIADEEAERAVVGGHSR